uniref:Uncharacterized protein n=1 Tax=viral metagenome TaxID=1070528 RepID=A0A6M3M369_9ZZZZ
MDIYLLAQILQGEAGGMGPLGMMAVAMSLSCRIWQHEHDMERIAAEYFGRADPGPAAILLAKLVEGQELPENKYFYCMGEAVDVRPRNWVDGDAVVRVGKDAIHLYEKWPEVRDETTGLSDSTK